MSLVFFFLLLSLSFVNFIHFDCHLNVSQVENKEKKSNWFRGKLSVKLKTKSDKTKESCSRFGFFSFFIFTIENLVSWRQADDECESQNRRKREKNKRIRLTFGWRTSWFRCRKLFKCNFHSCFGFYCSLDETIFHRFAASSRFCSFGRQVSETNDSFLSLFFLFLTLLYSAHCSSRRRLRLRHLSSLNPNEKRNSTKLVYSERWLMIFLYFQFCFLSS